MSTITESEFKDTVAAEISASNIVVKRKPPGPFSYEGVSRIIRTGCACPIDALSLEEVARVGKHIAELAHYASKTELCNCVMYFYQEKPGSKVFAVQFDK
jgi:hypothetical protein